MVTDAFDNGVPDEFVMEDEVDDSHDTFTLVCDYFFTA
jgi:hypothetical protein